MGKAWQHFKTITRHKYLVAKGCFQVGLYRQGLTHDLSKYGPTEFATGIKYYQGNRSPNAAERDEKGYSAAWLHHKGRNRHHWEYWIDFTRSGMKPVPMPDRYLVEMVMDRIAASKVYNGEKYRDGDALAYFEKAEGHQDFMHPQTRDRLRELLEMLARKGEKETFRYIREDFLKKGRG